MKGFGLWLIPATIGIAMIVFTTKKWRMSRKKTATCTMDQKADTGLRDKDQERKSQEEDP